jgi:hypothetical protein
VLAVTVVEEAQTLTAVATVGRVYQDVLRGHRHYRRHFSGLVLDRLLLDQLYADAEGGRQVFLVVARVRSCLGPSFSGFFLS